MKEPCQYKYKCLDKSDDDICNNFSNACKIHKDYEIRRKQKEQYELDIKRMYEMNDNGLTRFGDYL